MPNQKYGNIFIPYRTESRVLRAFGMQSVSRSSKRPDTRVKRKYKGRERFCCLLWLHRCPSVRTLLWGFALCSTSEESRVCRGWSLAMNPSQEGIRGRKKDADLLKKQPRTELQNSTQDVGEQKVSVKGGPASLQHKASCGLTGTHLTWWPRTAAGARWQGTRSSWLHSSPGRPRRSGPGASPLPGAPAGRPRPASSSRAAGGCRDLHGWQDRERAAVPALKSPPATALFPAGSRLCPVDSVYGTAPLNCICHLPTSP